MAITKLSSREFNQDTSRAKRAAKKGPVFITDRGRPSHVLLTAEEYERITSGQKSIADLLAMPEAAEVEFEPPAFDRRSPSADGSVLMYVLDTNVISELRKGKKAQRSVRMWAQALPTASLFLSVVSVLELEIGTLLVERRDRNQGAILRAWIDGHVLPSFSGRILAIDTAVAQRCASLHVPNPRSDRDALIAATALVHGMTVVTRNVSDFQATGVAVVNPWQ